MLGLVVFLREFKKEVGEKDKGAVREAGEEHEQEETYYLFPYRPINIIKNFLKPTNTNHTHSTLLATITSHHRYFRV